MRTDLAKLSRHDRIVADALEAKLNTLVVQVRGRGDAWFEGGVEPQPTGLDHADPLYEIVDRALAEGLFIHAWVNANLVGSSDGSTLAPTHLARVHPEWLMVPEPKAQALLALEPSDPRFLSGLLQYAKERPNEVEGIYGDPANPAYRAHVASIAADLATRYAIDGIHLDYIRYPGSNWGFSRAGLAEFRRFLEPKLTAAEMKEARAKANDPTWLARKFPARWQEFRLASVTAMVREVSRAVRAARSTCAMSAAVFPDPDSAKLKVAQDWTRWLEDGVLDFACPMNYAKEAGEWTRLLERELTAKGPIWAGIGAYQIDAEETRTRMGLSQSRGAAGFMLFSHSSLRARGILPSSRP